jgi:predicted deacylase
MSAKISRKELNIGERADKSRIALPVIQYKGTPGPSVFIGSAVHGDELTGQASLWRLYDYLKDKEIKGAITIMPVMNPDGLSFSLRGIPGTDVDLNRLYPGRADGYISERITAKVWEVAKKHDVVIDLHTMGLGVPMILIDRLSGDLKVKTGMLAEATGLTVLEEHAPEEYALQNLAASLGSVASAANIPNVTIELGGGKTIDWGSVEAGFLAMKNVLVHLGVVSGAIQKIKSSIVIREKGYCVQDVLSEKGGIIEYTVNLGDWVRKGATLAKIRNLFGDVVEEVKMPEDGYIILESYMSATQTGGEIATIAVKKK